MMSGRDIVIAGSGNVATHLCRALAPRVAAVISRNPDHAQALAEECGVPVSGDLSLPLGETGADIIIVSVADSAVDEVAAAIGPVASEPLVVHTSGTVPREAVSRISPRTGILYPLQSFSKDAKVELAEVPFFIEAERAEDLPLVRGVALSMSPKVHDTCPEQRKLLHVAGVFSSNFPNIMLEIAENILRQAGYPADTVKPLVEATVAKAFALGAHSAQTGPARRGDRKVIESHTAMLEPAEAEIYSLLSNYILKSHEQN